MTCFAFIEEVIPFKLFLDFFQPPQSQECQVRADPAAQVLQKK